MKSATKCMVGSLVLPFYVPKMTAANTFYQVQYDFLGSTYEEALR